MKININLKKIIVILTFIIVFFNTTILNLNSIVYAENVPTNLEIEKISNPDAGEGEADGLIPGGDRETSYAWAMATRGEYVYVGTNRNVIGNVASAFVNAIMQSGATEEQAWAMVNLFTGNAIPRPTKTTGEIYKCNILTGEITHVFTPEGNGVAFRSAIEFEGMLYFCAYSADITATSCIYKIDENDTITEVFKSRMRAACIHNNELYFGGVDTRYTVDEGDEDCVGIAIVKKDLNDDTKWERIADYKDFKEYASDPGIKDSASSPIWDICSYNGEIYATIPNTFGVVMYKGHLAEENEQSNEYGWCWTEVIGKNNGVNNIGLADTSEGQSGDNLGLISASATPFQFNNKLYLMDFDNTIQAEVIALSGLLTAITTEGTENEPDLSQYLKPMYTTLNHPQVLWVYDDETGKFNKVEAFSQYMESTCNEYLWRAEIYNNELYITTMDSAIIYSLATQFKGNHFTRMTEEELDEAVTKIDALIQKIEGFAYANEDIKEIVNLLQQTKSMINEYKSAMNNSQLFNDFVVKYEEVIGNLEKLAENVVSTGTNFITEYLLDLCTKVDWDALRMYAYIVKMVENDTWGFDMLKTANGENFEVVTNSGFGDKFNYGGRSLITTDEGLYLGTANPFYGAQLWRISKKTEDTPTDPPIDNPGNEPTDGPTDPPIDNPGNEPTDEPTNPPIDTPSQDTGATEEELNKIKEQLNTIIKNHEKLEEELSRLTEEISGLKNNTNNNSSTNNADSNDSTIASGKLPQTGASRILIALIVVLTIGAVAAVKHLKYRKIDIH